MLGRYCWVIAGVTLLGSTLSALAQGTAEPVAPTFAITDAEVGLAYPMPDERVVALIDIDLDGYLDVIIGGRVWRNNGRNRFESPLVVRGMFFSFGDFDNDGDLDVLATSSHKETIKTGQEDEKPKETARATPGGRGRQVEQPKEPEKPKPIQKTKADYWLLRNDGNGKFTDVLSKSGLTGSTEAKKDRRPDAAKYELVENILDVSQAHGFLDYDNDGNLDLFVAGHEIVYSKEQRRALPSGLFKGDGAGHFVEVSGPAGFDGVTPRPATAVAFCDFDNDGFVDIYVANDRSQPNYLWRNQGDGTFKEIAEEVGATAGAANSKTVVVGDYDNDGDFDIFVVNFAHDNPGKPEPRSVLLRNDLIPDGALHFTDVTAEAGLAWQPPEGFKAEATWLSAVWADLNNDGWLDLFVTETSNGGKNHPAAPMKYGRLDSGYSKLWLGREGQPFARVDTERNKLRIEDCAGVAAGDFDNDGWCDLLVGSMGGEKSEKITWFDPGKQLTTLLRGRGMGPKVDAAQTGYLNVTLIAHDRPLNGAVVEVTLGNEQRLRAVLDTSGSGLTAKCNQLHFGLGAQSAQRVSVSLPGGNSIGFEGPWRDTGLVLDLSKKSPKDPRTIEAWK